VYRTGKSYKKALTHPSRGLFFLHLIQYSLFYPNIFFTNNSNSLVKMKFSTTMIAFVAAGLASAQIPDVPLCSVRSQNDTPIYPRDAFVDVY
jgi:hypothetical protein